MGRFSTFSLTSLQHDHHGWHLPRATAKDWKTFERLLRQMGEHLHCFLMKMFPHIECIWTIPANPGSYGYFEAHKSQDEAFAAVKDSIRAFVLYAAYISFLIGLFHCHQRPGDWVNYTTSTLLQDVDISAHPAWTSELEESGIGGFNNGWRRQGCIVNIPHCRWRNLIPFMIKLEIPLWFYWGTKPFADVSGTWAHYYRPNPYAREPGVLLPMPVVIPPDFPPVIPNSGQHPGEDINTYFMRRTAENQKWLATQDPQAKQSRLDRQAKQSTKPCPGKKGPTVYQWVDNNGIRIREPVPRRQVELTWDSYASHQIKYDSFSNQFDVCTDFEDGPVDIDDGSESDLDISPTLSQPLPATNAAGPSDLSRAHPSNPSPILGPMPPSQQSCPPLQPLLSEVAPQSDSSQGMASQTGMVTAVEDGLEVNNDMDVDAIEKSVVPGHHFEEDDNVGAGNIFEMSVQDILTRNPIIPDEEPPPEVQSLENLVYCRYGFFLDETPYESPKEIKESIKDLTSVCRTVGGQHLELSSKESLLPIKDFINILANTHRPLSKVPAKYWDLNEANLGSLGAQESHFRIEVKQFKGEALCFLHPRGLELSKCPPWILAVPPMTALECIRRGLGPDPFALAEYLTTHGMEFRTLQQLASRPVIERPGPPSSTLMLGKRLYQHRYDSADLAKYMSTVTSYLEDHSHARRALSVGGLIARLARDVLPVSAILAGPSQDALEGKQDVLCCGDEVYVDDGLPEEVMQMMCGTYAQETQYASMSYLYSPVSVINCPFLQIKLRCIPGFQPSRCGIIQALMWAIGTLNVRSGTLGIVRTLLQALIFRLQPQNGGNASG